MRSVTIDAHIDAEHVSDWIQGKVRLDIAAGSEPASIPNSRHRWRFTVENDLAFNRFLDLVADETSIRFWAQAGD